MLRITVPSSEVFDESTNRIFEIPGADLELEHSLSSLSKWESEFKKPFLDDSDKTPEEILGYAYHMIVTPGISRDIVHNLTRENLQAINDYIADPMTATTFGEMPKRPGRKEIITSELIYYWMVAFTIPWEAEHWHLNRLFALIRICNVKNQKPEKMSKHEIAQRNRELNAQRKAKYGTKG